VRKLLQIVTLIATAQPLAGQTARRSFVAAREPVPQMHDGIVHVLSGVMSPQRRELQTPPVQSRPTSVLILGGLAGGMVGGLLGGAVGAGLFGGIGEGACSYEEWVCRLHGFYWGAVVGESLGVPAGVHLANNRRGDLLLSTLVSSALGAAGSIAIVAAGFDPPVAPIVLVAVPVAQITASTLIARRAAH
jgi:hypothetical protein